MNRSLCVLTAVLLAAACIPAQAKEKPRKGEPVDVVKRTRDLGSLDDWRSPTGDWMTCGGVNTNGNPALLQAEAGDGVLVNGKEGKTANLVSKVEHGDVEAELEFYVPKGSNSGVYFQGRYEIQVFDSHGVPKPEHSDCGGIYQRWRDGRGFDGKPPKVNAAKPAGEWQKLYVMFRAPRFDTSGRKTENARFVRVILNGKLIHDNATVTGPTRSAWKEDSEEATGPLMLQGDHGPVAYRNIKLKRLKL